MKEAAPLTAPHMKGERAGPRLSLNRLSNGFYQYFFSDPRIRAFTATREFNARFEEEAPGERKRLFDALNLSPSQAVGACQTHGNRIQIIDRSHQGRGAIREMDAFPGTDGFIAQEPGVVLTIKTADCLPLFIADPSTLAVSVIHAGWKGLYSGIVEKGLRALKGQYGSDPAELEAVLGPCIRFEDYEVGEEFRKYFPDHVKSIKGSSKPHFDLPGAARERLLHAGFREEHILDSGLSTVGNVQDFFSYRREGAASGRLLSLIWREP